MKKLLFTLSICALLPATAMATPWECENTVGGYYMFIPDMPAVFYYGPCSLQEVLRQEKKDAYGTVSHIVPFLSFDMDFPGIGKWSCRNSFNNTWSCTSPAAWPITLVSCKLL